MTIRLRAIIKYSVKEIRTLIKIFAVLNCITALVLFYDLSGILSKGAGYDHYTFYLNGIVNTFRVMSVFFILLLIFLAILQYTDIKDPGTYCFTSSLPVKKGTWLSVKISIGIIMLLLSYVFMALVSTVLYFIYSPVFARANISSAYFSELCRADSLGNGLIYMLYMYLLFIAVYLLLMFCQSITGNIAAGLFITAAIIFAPRYLMGTANNIMLVFNNKELPNYNILHSISIDYLLFDIDEILPGARTGFTDISFVPVRLTIFAVTDVLLFITNIVVQKRTDYSAPKLFINGLVEKIAIIVGGIYVACVIPQISESKQHGLPFLLIIMGLTALLTVILLWRYLRTEGKYDYLNSGKER